MKKTHSTGFHLWGINRDKKSTVLINNQIHTAELEEKISEQSSVNKDLRSSIQQNEKTIADLVDKLETLLFELDSQIEEVLENEIDTIPTIQEIKVSLTQLSIDFQNLKNNFEMDLKPELEEKFLDLVNQIDIVKGNANKSLNDKAENLQHQLGEIQIKLDKLNEAMKTETEAVLEKLKLQTNSLITNETLDHHLSILTNELADLKEPKVNDEEIIQLKLELAEIKTQSTTSTVNVQEKMESLTNEINNLKQRSIETVKVKESTPVNDEEIEKLKMDIEGIKTQSRTSTVDVQEKLESLLNEINNLKHRPIETVAAKETAPANNEVQKLIMDLEGFKTETSTSTSTLQQKLESLSIEINNLKQTSESIVALNEKFEVFESDQDLNEQRLEQLESNVKKFTTQFENVLADIDDLLSKWLNLDRQDEQFQGRISEINSILIEQSTVNNDFRSALNIFKEELKTSLETFKSHQVPPTEASTDSQRQYLDRIIKLETDSTIHKTQLEEMSKSIQDLINQNLSLDVELALRMLNDKISTLGTVNLDLSQTEIKKKNSQLVQFENSQTELSEKVQSLEAKVGAIKPKNYDEEIQALNTKISELESHSHSEYAMLNHTHEALNVLDEVRKFKEQLANLERLQNENSTENLAEQINSLQENINKISLVCVKTEELSIITGKLEDLESKFHIEESDYNSLIKTLNDLKTINPQTVLEPDALSKLQERITNLENNFELGKSELNSLMQKCEEFKTTNQTVIEPEQLDQRINALNNENISKMETLQQSIQSSIRQQNEKFETLKVFSTKLETEINEQNKRHNQKHSDMEAKLLSQMNAIKSLNNDQNAEFKANLTKFTEINAQIEIQKSNIILGKQELESLKNNLNSDILQLKEQCKQFAKSDMVNLLHGAVQIQSNKLQEVVTKVEGNVDEVQKLRAELDVLKIQTPVESVSSSEVQQLNQSIEFVKSETNRFADVMVNEELPRLKNEIENDFERIIANSSSYEKLTNSIKNLSDNVNKNLTVVQLSSYEILPENSFITFQTGTQKYFAHFDAIIVGVAFYVPEDAGIFKLILHNNRGKSLDLRQTERGKSVQYHEINYPIKYGEYLQFHSSAKRAPTYAKPSFYAEIYFRVIPPLV